MDQFMLGERAQPQCYEQVARIGTPRLYLRPMLESDAELVVSWRNESTALAIFCSNEEISVASHIDWFRAHRNNRVDYVFCETQQGKPIGTVNFKDINKRTGSAEAGKLLGDISYRGKGLAAEAFAAWLLYGFDVLKLSHIFVVTRADNLSNIKLNLKLGFKIVNGDAAPQPFSEGFINMEIFSEAASAIRQTTH